MFCPLFSLPNPKEGLTSDRSVAGYVASCQSAPGGGRSRNTAQLIVVNEC